MDDDLAAARGAIAGGIEHLRDVQHPDGYWLAGWWGFNLLHSYALALVYCGHGPESEILQDIAGQLEACVRADGGMSFTEEAPSATRWTTQGLQILRYARPRSPAIPQLERFLDREGHDPPTPNNLLARWVLEPSTRDQLLRFEPGPRSLRRLAWRVTPRLLVPPKKAPKLETSKLERRLAEQFFLWLAWPDPTHLVDHFDALPVPFTIPMYLSFLAIQLLAKDGPLAKDRESTERLVPKMIDKYLFDDGSIYYLNALLPTLVCLRELGRHEDEKRVRAAVERIDYRRGGYMATCMAGMNIFDTGLAVEALRACRVSDEDPTMARSLAFLRTAQRTDGLWSWAWDPRQGPRQRFGDTDDSSIALLALTGGGAPAPNASRAVDSYRRLQYPSGAFRTFDFPSEGYNPSTPSNNARSIMALLKLGLSRHDPTVRRAATWLKSRQEPKGAWFDWWMMNPVYGTSLAAQSLVESGASKVGDPEIERAVNRLLKLQNADGGWGFDWYGRRLRTSVVEHTGMAVQALAAITRRDARPMAPLAHAVRFLVDQQRPDGGWDARMVGQWDGYEGYRSTIFPVVFALKALGAYVDLQEEFAPKVPRLLKTIRLAKRERSDDA